MSIPKDFTEGDVITEELFNCLFNTEKQFFEATSDEVTAENVNPENSVIGEGEATSTIPNKEEPISQSEEPQAPLADETLQGVENAQEGGEVLNKEDAQAPTEEPVKEETLLEKIEEKVGEIVEEIKEKIENI